MSAAGTFTRCAARGAKRPGVDSSERRNIRLLVKALLRGEFGARGGPLTVLAQHQVHRRTVRAALPDAGPTDPPRDQHDEARTHSEPQRQGVYAGILDQPTP